LPWDGMRNLQDLLPRKEKQDQDEKGLAPLDEHLRSGYA
jgi:hypothetical protein